MLLGTIVTYHLRKKRSIQFLNFSYEFTLGIRTEYSESGIILLWVNGNWQFDLNGSDRIMLRYFSHIDFHIDKAFVSSLKEIFNVFGFLDEGLETDKRVFDLQFINFDECDGFLFLFDLLTTAFENETIVGKIFFDRFGFFR